jgi:hypothetical protein
VAKGASNSGVIGAMRRTPERGGGRALLPVVLLLVELASPRLVGAVTDAADGTFTLHSFLLPLGFVPFRSVPFRSAAVGSRIPARPAGSVPFRPVLRSCAGLSSANSRAWSGRAGASSGFIACSGGKQGIDCAAARGEAPRSSAGGASGGSCRFSLCCRQPVS